MTILALPSLHATAVGVESVNWRLGRNVVTPQSGLSRTIQRLIRSGNPWLADLQFPPYRGDDAGVIEGWQDEASRGDRWFYLTPPHNDLRGGWAPADLVSNGRFLTNTTGWTASGSTLSLNTRRLKIKNSGAANGHARQNVAMEVGKPHVLLFDTVLGKVTAAQATVRRQSDDVAEADTGDLVAPTRGVLLVTPTVGGMYVQLSVDTAVAGDDLFYTGVSLTRCLQVNGAGQTGNRLNASGAPANVNAALKVGQFVCVKVGTLYQLLRLKEDFDSDGSGTGTLVFEPTLRGSPADQAAVIVRFPFVRFFLPDHSSEAAIGAPDFRGFGVTGAEDITP